MDLQKFGIKELYEATLKATNSMTVGNKTFSPGEVVFHLKNVDVANIGQQLDIKDARGGKHNPWLLSFVEGKDTTITLQSGTMTKHNFAILHGANIVNSMDPIIVPYNTENTVSIDNKLVLDKIIDTTQNNFIYIKNNDSYDLITDYTVDTQTGIISFTNDYSGKSAIVNAYLTYENGVSGFTIGAERLQGFFKFEGKSYYTDEKNGLSKTILLTAPKVQIISDLQLYLGEKASPIVTTISLRAQNMPMYRGNKDVCMSIQMLDSDIDAFL